MNYFCVASFTECNYFQVNSYYCVTINSSHLFLVGVVFSNVWIYYSFF